jgi:hypothetical protein
MVLMPLLLLSLLLLIQLHCTATPSPFQPLRTLDCP